MQDRGLKGRYGTWLITGRPKVVLLEQASVYDRLDKIKYFLWQNHDIPSPAGDWLYDNVVCFGYMVEQFLTGYMQHPSRRRPVIAHFHEWMAGSVIPALRRAALPLSIVFTTHATLLGRYGAMNDPWFYDHLPFVNWQDEARHYNILGQVKIERAAAHGRTCSPRSARSPITNAPTCWGARRTSCCPTASTSSGSRRCTSSRTCIASTSSTFTGS